MYPSKKTTLARPDWSALPPDLLITIARHLTLFDHLQFRGVCKSWLYAATSGNFIARLPWLMYMSTDEKLVTNLDGCKKTIKFLDMFDNNRVFNRTMFSFPEYELGTKFFSCSGWLLGIKEDTIKLELIHATRGTRLGLPGLDTFPGFNRWYLYDQHANGNFFGMNYFNMMGASKPRCFIKKMAMLRLPEIESFMVVVIWGEKNQLGFARPGESTWKVLDSWDESFSDVICHNRIVYALDFNLRIVSCDIRGHVPTEIQLVFTYPSFGLKYPLCYLVVDSSSGRFILVIPIVDDEIDNAADMEELVEMGEDLAYLADFGMFECDLTVGSGCKLISDIGNKVLFLGFNSSMCLDVRPDASASFSSEPERCAIYLTDWDVYTRMYNNVHHKHETKMGIYRGGARRDDCMPSRSSGEAYVAPLLWVLPSL